MSEPLEQPVVNAPAEAVEAKESAVAAAPMQAAPTVPAQAAAPIPQAIPQQPPMPVFKTFCTHCGAGIPDNQSYCSSCGRSIADPKIIHCTKCGTVIAKGQKFCSTCGSNVKSVDRLVNNAKTKASTGKGKKLISIIAVVLVIAIIGVGFKQAAPKIFVSPEELMSQGNYQKAYEKSKDKEAVLLENLLVTLCADDKTNDKNPDSYRLIEAWFRLDKTKGEVVLKSSGTNSYGGTVSSYSYYTCDKDDSEYSLYCSLSSLEDDEYHSWDDSDDRVEKFFKNLARSNVKSIINNKSYKVSVEAVERINKLNDDGMLEKVALLNETQELCPKQTDSEKQNKA